MQKPIRNKEGSGGSRILLYITNYLRGQIHRNAFIVQLGGQLLCDNDDNSRDGANMAIIVGS